MLWVSKAWVISRAGMFSPEELKTRVVVDRQVAVDVTGCVETRVLVTGTLDVRVVVE